MAFGVCESDGMWKGTHPIRPFLVKLSRGDLISAQYCIASTHNTGTTSEPSAMALAPQEARLTLCLLCDPG